MDDHKLNPPPINHHLARLAKIHRYAPVYIGLYLPKPPVGASGMTYQHARLQNCAHTPDAAVFLIHPEGSPA
jgi:hypothetical protein